MEIGGYSLDERLPIAGEVGVAPRDDADFHAVVDLEWDGDDVLAVELVRDHTRAHRVTIEAYEQVEQGRAVAHANVLGTAERGQRFLGEVERVEIPLLVGEVRIVCKILERDRGTFRQGMGRGEEHVRGGGEQGLEFEILGAQHAADHVAIGIR